MLFACALPAASCLASAAATRIAAPELFAQGTISTTDDEYGIAFTPDGRTAYFTKRSPTTNTTARSMICVTHLIDGHWSEPEVAPFSGVYNDFGIAIAPDGKRIVFSSDRPNTPAADTKALNIDLWAIDRERDGWSEPGNLGTPVNTPAAEAYPSLAADGTLYFSSGRPGGKGSADLYRSRLVDGRYADPENLTDINTAGYESQPAIAPDQSMLVFIASDRSDTLASNGAPYPRPDLYASSRSSKGWSTPRHLDAPINSTANEGAPGFSADGRWLYFSSDRSIVSLPMPRRLSAREYEDRLHGVLDGWNNIYRVAATALGQARDAGHDQKVSP
jgi:Tol biopolymer transport system component